MSKSKKLEELLEVCKNIIPNIEKEFDEDLIMGGFDPLLLKKGDPIQYEVGLRDFTGETKFRLKEELKQIVNGKENESNQKIVEEIEIYLN